MGNNELQAVGRGQEFVANVGDLAEPKDWLGVTLEAIEGSARSKT
jgi:hypothetical protein